MDTRHCKKWLVFSGILVLVFLSLVGKGSWADEYPSQTIKIICGYSAGGSLDRQIRLLIPFLQKHLGKSVIEENLTGAQAMLATNKVFSSPPDGYTLLIAGTWISLQEKYLPETARYRSHEFTHLFAFVKDYGILLTHPEVYKNFSEFSNAAQGKKLRVAISGKGTPTDLYVVMLEEMAKMNFNIVPFEGGGPSMTALIGKHVEASSTILSGCYNLIRGGTLNPILIFSDRRHPSLPQTPVPGDLGFKSFEPFDYITGIFGPPKMPKDRVKILEDAFFKAVKEPEYQEKAKAMYVDIYPLNSRDFTAISEKAYNQIDRYIKILKGE